MDDDSIVEIPYPDELGNYTPSSENLAWKASLINIHHNLKQIDFPSHIKFEIENFIDSLLLRATLTNIHERQIMEFLADWDEYIHTLKIFNRVIDIPQYYSFKRLVRIELKTCLNAAKDGFRSEQVFENKTSYRVRQEQKQVDRVNRWKSRWNKKQVKEG